MRKIGKYEKLTPQMQKKVETYKRRQKNGTLKTYFYSVLCLVLCCVMFLGTTFAWFTSEVSNTSNQISVGTLKVDLQDKEGNSVAGTPAIFSGDILWSPSHYEVSETLQIVNQGNLSFNYRLVLNGGGAADVLNQVGQYISVYLAKNPENDPMDWTYIGKLNHVIAGAVPLINGTFDYERDSQTVETFVIGMQMDVDAPNSIQGKTLSDISISLIATQKIQEEDIFGNKYDEADPLLGTATIVDGKSATMQIENAPSSTVKKLTNITVPANAFAAGSKIKAVVDTTNTLFNISAEGGVVASLDIKLYVDDVLFTADLPSGSAFTVSTYISTGLPVESVVASFVGSGSQPNNVHYDPETGLLVFQTTHFSTYTFSGKGLAYDPVADKVLNDIVEILAAIQDPDATVVIPSMNVKTSGTEKSPIQKAIEQAKNENRIDAAGETLILEAAAVAKIDEVTYINLADALAEADGKTVVLLKDIYLDADDTITIPEGTDITIDLNRKSIVGVTDDADKNDDGKLTSADNEVMFDVRGTLTVKNGMVTIRHMAENFGWNGCTEVFYVAFKGTLNLVDATIENLGGSDMAYAVDVVNATETTLNITGSTIKSTYIPVRVFNNAAGMNHVNMDNSEIHGGNRAFWVHIYTNKDNGGKGVKDSTLKFKIDYDTVTFSADKNSDAPICYGFTDAYRFDAKNNFQYIEAETEEALQAAFIEGWNVKLAGNIELTSSLIVPKEKQIKLDLNGKTISFTGTEAKTTYVITNNGELTIEDSAEGGKIELITGIADASYGYACNTILNNGALSVYGGTIQNNLGGASYAIDNNVGAVTTIYGGEIRNTNGTAIRVYSWDANTSSTLVVKGGRITGTYAVRSHILSAVAGKINVTIYDGVLTATDGFAIYSYSNGGSFANTVYTIAGGKFNGYVAFGGGYKGDEETVTITGGTFSDEVGRYTADGWEDIVVPAN